MVASSGLIFPVCFFIKAELCYVEVLKVLVCLRISVLFPVFVDFVFLSPLRCLKWLSILLITFIYVIVSSLNDLISNEFHEIVANKP